MGSHGVAVLLWLAAVVLAALLWRAIIILLNAAMERLWR